jgi:hypothetical protein
VLLPTLVNKSVEYSTHDCGEVTSGSGTAKERKTKNTSQGKLSLHIVSFITSTRYTVFALSTAT